MKNFKVVSCLMNNQKTACSIDMDTICPKKRFTIDCINKGLDLETIDKEKLMCDYCYVEYKRLIKFNAKIEYDHIGYKGEIKGLSNEQIDFLNSIGGIRLFSFSDYNPVYNNDLVTMFNDCRNRGLFVKVITKQVGFIDRFYDEFEDIFSIIHISIDNRGYGVNWKTAIDYRSKYEKVIIRSVILNMDDIEIMDKLSDIMTFNHENLKKRIPGSINFNANKKLFNELKEKYSSKMCCQETTCEKCPIKCKATNV